MTFLGGAGEELLGDEGFRSATKKRFFEDAVGKEAGGGCCV